MAGGTITRIVGGKLYKEIEEDYTVWADNFTMNSGGKISITSDKKIIFGSPPPPPPAGKYFVKGWWTDENDKPIKEAVLGDVVKFHIETKDIPDGKEITVKVYDYDTDMILGLDNLDEDDHIEIINNIGKNSEKIIVKENLAVQSFKTGNRSKELINEEGDQSLELYVNADYNNEEAVNLPEMESDYLIVKPKDLNGQFIFVSASTAHELPEMYDVEDKGIFYIVRSNAMYTNKVKGIAESISNPNKPNAVEKKAYEIAVRKLKAGNLYFNDGTTGANKRMYEYAIEDIDKKFSDKIVMAANKGNFTPGVTSKGINQLEAAMNTGLVAKSFKVVSGIMPLIGTLFDLAAMLVSVGNKELPAIPFMPPFISMEVAKMNEQINEWVYERFLLGIEEYKNDINKVEKFILQWNSANSNVDDWKYSWHLVRLSNETLNKLLTKEIEFEKQLTNLSYRDTSNPVNSGILVYSKYEIDEYKQEVLKHYVYCIYLPKIIER